MKRLALCFAVAVAAALPSPAVAQESSRAAADTAAVDTVVTPTGPRYRRGVFPDVSRDAYLRRHVFSLDQYIEYEPGLVLERRGPVGSDARFSRFGMGRGRALVTIGGVPINDPQSDVAPLVHFPVSGIGGLRFGADAGGALGATTTMEGTLSVTEFPSPETRPSTFLSLSKGTNELRQRRVRFSSVTGPVGIDVGYDELLNDGYVFDERSLTGDAVSSLGGSRSRYYTAGVRGAMPDGGAYAVRFRKFSSSVSGDLVSAGNESRRSGHLATAHLKHGRFRATFFGRGHGATDPDSATVNETTAGYASLDLARSRRRVVTITAGVEDISATQDVGGAHADVSLVKTSGSVDAVMNISGGVQARASASAASYRDLTTGWGGGIDVAWRRGWLSAGAGARRGFRMPNLGELYLPPHTRGARIVAGNASLDPEWAWEGSGRVGITAGPLRNELSVTSIRSKDTIAPRHDERSDGVYLLPVNTSGELLTVFEDRVEFTLSWNGLEIAASGSAAVADGERTGYFRSVPETRFGASLRVGGNLFEATSALYAGVDVLYGGERADYDGKPLSDYRVVNISFDGRLLDADMYLAFLNALDEDYTTSSGFLMTPRTFVYGIAWTLFE